MFGALKIGLGGIFAIVIGIILIVITIQEKPAERDYSMIGSGVAAIVVGAIMTAFAGYALRAMAQGPSEPMQMTEVKPTQLDLSQNRKSPQ